MPHGRHPAAHSSHDKSENRRKNAVYKQFRISPINMRSCYSYLALLLVCKAWLVVCIVSPSTAIPIVPLAHLERRNFNTTLARHKPHVVVKRSYAPIIGVSSVVAILGSAIARLMPIAKLPFLAPIPSTQAIAYVVFVMFMLFIQGYKAFHLKFSPLVVARASHLPSESLLFRTLLAGPYCMGLIGATKKRMIISWGTSIGVTLLIVLVKYLPYPWRSIVDGGAVAGLTVGTLSILWHYYRLLRGVMPSVDPCLPV